MSKLDIRCLKGAWVVDKGDDRLLDGIIRSVRIDYNDEPRIGIMQEGGKTEYMHSDMLCTYYHHPVEYATPEEVERLWENHINYVHREGKYRGRK